MLEDGSISQDQFDTQLRDKIGKQLKQLTKRFASFSNLSGNERWVNSRSSNN